MIFPGSWRARCNRGAVGARSYAARPSAVVVAQAAVRLQILPWPTSRQFHADAGMPETVVSYGRGRAGPSDVLGNPVAHRPVGRHHLRQRDWQMESDMILIR